MGFIQTDDEKTGNICPACKMDLPEDGKCIRCGWNSNIGYGNFIVGVAG